MSERSLQEFLSEARHLIKLESYAEAIEIARHILLYYPKHIESYALLGQASLEKGKIREAVELFQRALSANPLHVTAWIGLASAYEQDELGDLTLWHLERAFELEPANGGVRVAVQELYGARRGVKELRLKLNSAALGRVYLKNGLYQPAVNEFTAVLAKEPERFEIKTSLALAYWHLGKRQEAASLCLELLDQLPNCLQANLLLGEIWTRGDREEEGRERLHLAEALDPENAVASELLGHESPLSPGSPKLPPLGSLPLKPATRSERHPLPGMRELASLSATVGRTTSPVQEEGGDDVKAWPSWLEDAGQPPETRSDREDVSVERGATAAQDVAEEPEAQEEPPAVDESSAIEDVGIGEIPTRLQAAGEQVLEADEAARETTPWAMGQEEQAAELPAFGGETTVPSDELPSWLKETIGEDRLAEAPAWAAPEGQPPDEDVWALTRELPEDLRALVEETLAGEEQAPAEAPLDAPEPVARSDISESTEVESAPVEQAFPEVEESSWLLEEVQAAEGPVQSVSDEGRSHEDLWALVEELPEDLRALVEETLAEEEQLPTITATPSLEPQRVTEEIVELDSVDDARVADGIVEDEAQEAEGETGVELVEVATEWTVPEDEAAEGPQCDAPQTDEEIPSWLRQMVQETIEEPHAGPPSSISEAVPQSDENTRVRDEEVPSWLTALAKAAEHVPSVEPTSQPPASDDEGIPSWLRKMADRKRDEADAAAVAATLPDVEHEAKAIPDVRAPEADSALPDWLDELRKQALAGGPAFAEEIAAEESASEINALESEGPELQAEIESIMPDVAQETLDVSGGPQIDTMDEEVAAGVLTSGEEAEVEEGLERLPAPLTPPDESPTASSADVETAHDVSAIEPAGPSQPVSTALEAEPSVPEEDHEVSSSMMEEMLFAEMSEVEPETLRDVGSDSALKPLASDETLELPPQEVIGAVEASLQPTEGESPVAPAESTSEQGGIEGAPTPFIQQALQRLAVRPDDHQMRLALARAWRDAGQLESAAENYDALIEVSQYLDSIVNDLESWAESRQDQRPALVLLGAAYMKQGRLSDAMEAYRRALGRA